jgi:hypothetical protein
VTLYRRPLERSSIAERNAAEAFAARERMRQALIERLRSAQILCATLAVSDAKQSGGEWGNLEDAVDAIRRRAIRAATLAA